MDGGAGFMGGSLGHMKHLHLEAWQCLTCPRRLLANAFQELLLARCLHVDLEGWCAHQCHSIDENAGFFDDTIDTAWIVE